MASNRQSLPPLRLANHNRPVPEKVGTQQVAFRVERSRELLQETLLDHLCGQNVVREKLSEQIWNSYAQTRIQSFAVRLTVAQTPVNCPVLDLPEPIVVNRGRERCSALCGPGP